MPPKEDVSELYGLLRNLWPDFTVTKEDLRKPTADFVMRFYTTFVSEICDKVSFITRDDYNLAEFNDNPAFQLEVHRLCQVSEIWKHFGVMNSPILTDFYDPFPKRIYHLFKLAVHFVIFVITNLDEMASYAIETNKCSVEQNQLEIVRQQLLQDNAVNAENIAQADCDYEKLKNRLELAKKKHTEMLQCKADKEVKYTEKSSENQNLANELEDLEYMVKNIETEENHLRERTVDDDEFNRYKATKKELELEKENLNDIEGKFQDVGDDESEVVEFLASCAEQLEKINHDSLNVRPKYELEQELLLFQNKQKSLMEPLDGFKVTIKNTRSNVKELRKSLENGEKPYKEFKMKVMSDVQNAKTSYVTKTEENQVKVQEFQGLLKKIADKKSKISEINVAMHVFNEGFSKAYAEMLEKERTTCHRFEQYLENVKEAERFVQK